jgi:hypothetical protein
MVDVTNFLNSISKKQQPKTVVPEASATGKAHSSSDNTAPSSNQDLVITDTVRTMQKLMADLGAQLSGAVNAKSVKNTFHDSSLTVNEIQGLAVRFSNTAAAGLGRASADGIWGSKTRRELLAIKELVSKLRIKDVTITEGVGKSPYKQDKNILAEAKQNIDNLSNIFKAVGLSTTIDIPDTNNDAGTLIVDMVPTNLSRDGSDNPFVNWGNFPVRVGDVSSLSEFFKFVGFLQPPFPCEPLNKGEAHTGGVDLGYASDNATTSYEDYIQTMAQEVLEGSIYRLSQKQWFAPQNKSVAPPKADAHCFSVFESTLKWFRDRAKAIWVPIYKSFTPSPSVSPRPDRRNRKTSYLDMQLAEYYNNKMEEMLNEWDRIRDSVLEALKEKNSPIITSNILQEALGHSRGAGAMEEGHGRAHRSKEEGASGSDKGGRTVHDEQIAPPLARFISLRNFEEYQVPSLTDVSKYMARGNLPVFDTTQMTSWTAFVSQLAGKTYADKIRNFGPWISAVKGTINEVYDDWLETNPNDDEAAKQNRLKIMWIRKLDHLYDVWRQEYRSQILQASQNGR